jgi:hypothetical protein
LRGASASWLVLRSLLSVAAIYQVAAAARLSTGTKLEIEAVAN